MVRYEVEEKYASGAEAWKRAKELFRKPTRFDLTRKDPHGKWIYTDPQDRQKFLKELKKQNIQFILKTATAYGCARIYIDKANRKRVEEIYMSLFSQK